ncbi:MAG: Gfo/Idh/MocA family protein [Eubacteriales bacterium]
MDKNNIGYAVLGLGVGMGHVRGAMDLRGGRLVAVCDLCEDRLAKAVDACKDSKSKDVRTYTNFTKMLNDPDVDVVSIATPSGMHAYHAIMAMNAGKHVLIEKPIDVSVARAEEIVRVWKMMGVKASCVFQCRRWPCITEVKRVLDEGKLGEVFSGLYRINWLRTDEYYAQPIASGEAWRGTWQWDGGGSLMNQGVHTTDLMQWLMGGVESVTSATKIFNHKIETEDFTSSIVRFKSGAIGNLVSTTCNGGKTTTDLQFFGTKGSVCIENTKITSWVVPGEDEAEMIAKYADGGAAVTKDAAAAQGHAFHVQDLIDAIREDRKPYIQPDEALNALKVVLAVYKSAREGREVRIDEIK